jgi:hypothetical protein
MDKFDEFRANAEECQRMADGTKNPGDKRRWLQMAQAWLHMIKGPTAASAPTVPSASEAPISEN